ncbi:dUTP diphosphatase [Perkinsela sp. CCAP 1560/4]|nr:dUTP diphosphatase [Perkinsela sp. CCAP 1560/4]|eukprot:KNH07443.1 dUTP diphosphatase [Perkinsela sp. CCAP 1560/4]
MPHSPDDQSLTEILAKLSQMQNALNRFIDPDWKANRSLDDWALAITLETAELIESYPWKWWKNIAAPADMKNVRIELVDILHFALSGAAQGGADEGSETGEAEASLAATAAVTKGTKEAIQVYRQIIRDADMKKFHLVLRKVFAIAAHYDFNIIAYYVAKHTLNHVRQLGGYKKDSYQKINPEGMEDNEMLHSCIAQISSAEIIGDFEGVGNSILTSVYNVFEIPEHQRNTIVKWME